jgi:hypothetical protein
MNIANTAVINKENSCHSQYSLKFVLKFVERIGTNSKSKYGGKHVIS